MHLEMSPSQCQPDGNAYFIQYLKNLRRRLVETCVCEPAGGDRLVTDGSTCATKDDMN